MIIPFSRWVGQKIITASIRDHYLARIMCILIIIKMFYWHKRENLISTF